MFADLYSHKWFRFSLPILLWGTDLFFQTTVNMHWLAFDLALLKATLIVLGHIMLFYLHVNVFLPRFFEKKQYWLYGLLVIGAFFLMSHIIEFFDDVLFKKNIQFPHHAPDKHDLHALKELGPRHIGRKPRLRFFRFFFLGQSILVYFISLLYYSSRNKRKTEAEKVLLQNQILEAESKFLRSQINPHFLFNALNNIYALSMMESKQTPEAIHKLSSMLRYVLYESKHDFVSLSKETDYLKDYIELYKLKDDSADNIKVNIDIQNTLLIAPMLLVPFIENCFKHGNIDDTENGWVNINLKTNDESIEFYCENTLASVQGTKDKQGGVGLENVKQRLNLLYPNIHSLDIINNGDRFIVKMILQVKN